MANYQTRIRLISEDSINIANNTSRVTIAFDFRRTDYPYNGYNFEGSAYWNLVCNGSQTGAQHFNFDWSIGQNAWKEVNRHAFIVTHNADGSKNVNCSGTWFSGPGVSPGTLNASATFTLQTIPRATTPSLNTSSQNAGSAITINTPRATGSFTHDLTYWFGNASGTIATGVGTSYSWTLPWSLLNQIPSATSGQGTITCQTKNGSTNIGSSKSINFTCTCPGSIVPSISSVGVSEASSIPSALSGIFINSKSMIRFVTSSSGAYGSSISLCTVAFNGTTYSGTNIVSSVINTSGNITATINVKDSRGRTASTTRTVTVVDYYNPTINSLSARRSNSSGVEDINGTSLILGLNMKIAPVNNKNANSYKVEMKKDSDSSWTQILSGSAYTYNATAVVSGKTLDTDSSYQFRATVYDSFNTSGTSITTKLGTAFTLMDFNASGKGLAFGQVSQKSNYMEVALISEFLNAVKLNYGSNNYDLADKISSIMTSITNLTNSVNGKAPNNHASTLTSYGLANTNNYGHTKLANNLTTSSYSEGLALSANQGKVLGDKLGSLFTKVVASERVTVTSTSNTWLAIANVPNYSSSKKYFALVNCSTDVIIPYVRSSDGKLVAYGPLIRSGASYTVDYVVIQR